MKILVAYDGSFNSKIALKAGLHKAKGNGNELVVLHVFNSNMFIDYGAGPKAEEFARRESSLHRRDAEAIIGEAGACAKSSVVGSDGIPVDEVINYAAEEDVDMLLCPAGHKSLIKRFKEVLVEKGRDAVESEIFDNTGGIKIAAMVSGTKPIAARILSKKSEGGTDETKYYWIPFFPGFGAGARSISGSDGRHNIIKRFL